eukprot:5644655-Pyramimonas_sp.AAC.1
MCSTPRGHLKVAQAKQLGARNHPPQTLCVGKPDLVIWSRADYAKESRSPLRHSVCRRRPTLPRPAKPKVATFQCL